MEVSVIRLESSCLALSPEREYLTDTTLTDLLTLTSVGSSSVFEDVCEI